MHQKVFLRPGESTLNVSHFYNEGRPSAWLALANQVPPDALMTIVVISFCSRSSSSQESYQ
jgi:hypothetical protein